MLFLDFGTHIIVFYALARDTDGHMAILAATRSFFVQPARPYTRDFFIYS